MRKIINYIIVINLVFCHCRLFSQVTVTGSTCVGSGANYQYVVKGNAIGSKGLKICANGGMIMDLAGSKACILVNQLPATITVKWNDTTKNTKSLDITGPNVAINYVIQYSPVFYPGNMAKNSKSQVILFGKMPNMIMCFGSKGGPCQAQYNYQWQESTDVVSWKDIPGEKGENLRFKDILKNSTFFRRKIIESVSGTVAYSDPASVFVLTGQFDSTLLISQNLNQ